MIRLAANSDFFSRDLQNMLLSISKIEWNWVKV